jgi:hypothetical protein
MYEKQSYLSSKKAALQNGRLAHPSSPAFDNADLIGRRGQSKDCNASLNRGGNPRSGRNSSENLIKRMVHIFKGKGNIDHL